jgi:hypothetical protein
MEISSRSAIKRLLFPLFILLIITAAVAYQMLKYDKTMVIAKAQKRNPPNVPLSVSITLLICGLAIVCLFLYALRLARNLAARRFDDLAAKESDRLRRSAGLPSVSSPGIEPALRNIEESLRRRTSIEHESKYVELRSELAAIRDELHKEKGDATPPDAGLSMLVEVYSQAISQMKSSFILSQTFAAAGALTLLVGVVLAIFRASTNGQQIAAILTTVVGLVTDLTAGLFFVQSNRARKHLETQTIQLRDDVRLGELVEQAEAVVCRVDDVSRRDDLRTQIVDRILKNVDGKVLPRGSVAEHE